MIESTMLTGALLATPARQGARRIFRGEGLLTLTATTSKAPESTKFEF